MYSPLEQFDAISLKTFINYGYDLDFTLFSTLIPLFVLIALSGIINSIKREFTLIPKLLQSIVEINIEFIFNLIKQQIGRDGYILFPFIFTLFNFILGSNLLSLLPFGIALTSHLIIILWLSLTLSLGIFIIGLYIHNIKFLRIFLPECPLILLPMLICIEIFSYVIKSFSLAIRLSANIMAGHTLVYIMSSFIIKVTYIEFWFIAIGFIILFAVLLLELGVAFLQAYVFTVLICIYIHDSFHPAH